MSQARNKLRECPAIRKSITPAECGAGRHSRIPCPADCRHNPWSPANYDQAGVIEQHVFDKLLQRLARERPDWYPKIHGDSMSRTQSYFTDAYFFRPNTDGLTLFQAWERARWEGLNNDQVVFLKALANQSATLIEALDMKSAEDTLVRDRLDPDRPLFLVKDRTMAASAGRFACRLAFLVEMPHYTRLNGVAMTLPLLDGLEAEDVIRAIAAHQGWPTDNATLRKLLVTRFDECAVALTAVGEAAEDAFFRNAVYTRTWYRLTIPAADFAAAMNRCPDAIPQPVDAESEPEATHEWAWKGPAEGAVPGTIPVLGRVVLDENDVRTESGGTARAKALREAFEQFHGGAVRFDRQRVDDLGGQRRARKGRAADPALVPPALAPHFPTMETTVSLVPAAEAQGKPEAVRNQHLESWADTPLPAFSGLTPREAAKDSTLRPRLVTMLKQNICRSDEGAIRGQPFTDEAVIARDLGLAELDYPVPFSLRNVASSTRRR